MHRPAPRSATLLSSALVAAPSMAEAADISGSLTATSDYVLRGVSRNSADGLIGAVARRGPNLPPPNPSEDRP